MKKLFKKVLFVTLALTFLVACGGTGNKDEDLITIDYWHTMHDTKGRAMDTVVDEFNDTIGKERGIFVNSVYQGDDVNEKLKTLAQSNDTSNFPDVAQVAGPATPSVMEYETTVTPHEMYEKGEDIIVPFEDLVPNAVRTFSYNDELKVMPFNVSSILLYYNVDMFEEAGLDPDNPPVTIDDLAETIEALTVVENDEVSRYGLNVQVKRYQLSNFIGSQGEFNFIGNNEGGRAGMMTELVSEQEIENFLKEWEKVVKTGGYQPVENNINEEFALGLHGMAIMSSARIAIIEELVGDSFEWRTANLPKVNSADTGGTATGGSGVAFFDKGDEERLTAAWLFSQYLASPEAQVEFDKNTGYLPVNIKAIEDQEYQTYLDENPHYRVPVEQMTNSHPNVQEPFDIINWVINDIVDEEMLAFGKEEQSVEVTRDNLVNKINAKLKEHAEANE